MTLILLTALSGTWLLDMHAASAAKVPVLGWQKSVTQTRSVVSIDDDGHWFQQPCSLEVHDRSAIADTRIPESFVASLPPTHAEVALTGDAFTVDLGTARVGHTADPLPERGDDPLVFDHEGDGLPGATVQVHLTALGTFHLQVVHVFHGVLTAEPEGDGFRGTVETKRLDQHVIGADSRLVNRSPELRADDEKSFFTLTRTEATSCADLARIEASVADGD